MPSQTISNVENNFTKGLITEATGLNFPENAATDASNCDFTIIGDTTRRLGINQEVNGVFAAVSDFQAMTDFVWNNPGGQSNKSLLVKQIDGVLYFYDISAATVTAPLSTQVLGSTVALSGYAITTLDLTIECEFTEGNGYLFVFQKGIQPFYCTYTSGTITSSLISLFTRDFTGVLDNLAVNTRPASLSATHQYNLQNQGWTQGGAWAAASTTNQAPSLGSMSWTVASGISGISNGQLVLVQGRAAGLPEYANLTGSVTGYSGTTLTINVISIDQNTPGFAFNNWTFTPTNTGYITSWVTAVGNYPSNADVWWYFKNSSDDYDPATTADNVTLASGNAPQGHYIMNPFNLARSSYSGVAGIDTVSTNNRPTTGVWWQGRMWYSGVNDSFAATTTTSFYTWTGNIYYSTTIQTPTDFGVCYQTNDPTSETLNGELPTDGGVIVIQETGTIHKLFAIQNGLLVFANNGIWFITGSQGIGFASNDFTVTKISSIRTLSSKSFVDVMGLPYFWNEEGIYTVTPSQNNSLTVEPLTVGTILTYYSDIPIQSKKYARGAYDPINYILQWTYRSTLETNISDRYHMDTILNYNVYNKAFYPYNIQTDANNSYINGVVYVTYPSITSQTPLPSLKYPMTTATAVSNISFAECYDDSYVDWGSVNYSSYFVVGYKLHGGAWRKFQVPYTYVYSRTDGSYGAYYIQGLWDYSTSSDSNRWSTPQFTEIFEANKSMVPRRHKIRGQGLVLQLKVSSVDGQPFDIMGWALYENLNTGA